MKKIFIKPGKKNKRIDEEDLGMLEGVVARVAKYEEINFTPPKGASNAAQKAIDWKEEHGDAVQGGTKVGWTRASQLTSGKPMSPETVRRMYKFFQRHQKNKSVKPEFKDEPWKDNGYVAWLIWGGDAGKTWAEKLWNQMEQEDKKQASRIAIRVAKKGLWDRIREKRERGEKPAKPGDEDYPDEEQWKKLTSSEPLRTRRDYGEKAAGVNPYLNTPPTKLNRDLKKEKDPKKRKQMKDALNAWRTTVPGPFRKSAEELLKIAEELMR